MSVPITPEQAAALYGLRKALRPGAQVSAMRPDGMLVSSGARAWVITPEGTTLKVAGTVTA